MFFDAQAQHQERGIPEDVSRSTLSDIGVWARAHRTGGMSPAHLRDGGEDEGVWGLGNLAWPMHSLNGEILRVGRFQHRLGKFKDPFEVYRHQKTRAVQMVVAESKIGFDKSGLMARIPTMPVSRLVLESRNAGGYVSRKEEVPDPAWRSERVRLNAGGGSAEDGYSHSGRTIRATPIAPSGLAEPRVVELDLHEWDLVLAKGDPILEIHIPEGSSMDVATCGEGLRRVAAEYRSWQRGGTSELTRSQRFRERGTFAAFVCSSWMLDPHYTTELAPTSNIVRFQRESYCFPTGAEGDGLSGYERLFSTDARRGTPPQTGGSSLQTAFLRHTSEGGRWVGGGCFLLHGDAERYGEQVYFGADYHARRRREAALEAADAAQDKVAEAA